MKSKYFTFEVIVKQISDLNISFWTKGLTLKQFLHYFFISVHFQGMIPLSMINLFLFKFWFVIYNSIPFWNLGTKVQSANKTFFIY